MVRLVINHPRYSVKVERCDPSPASAPARGLRATSVCQRAMSAERVVVAPAHSVKSPPKAATWAMNDRGGEEDTFYYFIYTIVPEAGARALWAVSRRVHSVRCVSLVAWGGVAPCMRKPGQHGAPAGAEIVVDEAAVGAALSPGEHDCARDEAIARSLHHRQLEQMHELNRQNGRKRKAVDKYTPE